MVNDPITFLLGLALGTTLYQLAKNLVIGAQMFREHRNLKRREALEAWRRKQQASWKRTVPTDHIKSEAPYLGLEDNTQPERKRA